MNNRPTLSRNTLVKLIVSMNVPERSRFQTRPCRRHKKDAEPRERLEHAKFLLEKATRKSGRNHRSCKALL